MFRRCTASLALAIAAAGSSPALASGTTNYADYELVNTRPTTVTDLIVANIVPPNSIEPPDPSTSPLTILNGSFGFDQKNLQVFLSPADPTTQQMALNFANGGLSPGGVLDFQLSLAPGVSSSAAPTLTLQSPDQDLELIGLPAPSGTTSATTTTTATSPPVTTTPTVPGPISLALWSVMASAGLVRARSFRRSRRATA